MENIQHLAKVFCVKGPRSLLDYFCAEVNIHKVNRQVSRSWIHAGVNALDMKAETMRGQSEWHGPLCCVRLGVDSGPGNSHALHLVNNLFDYIFTHYFKNS